MAVQISGNDITVPRDGTFSRNVSIAGTLTYEDVTNIDSVGLITARQGIEVGSGVGVAASISVDGNAEFAGIVTATQFVGNGANLTGVASTENIRTNTNATFLQNINVGVAITAGKLGIGFTDSNVKVGNTALNSLTTGTNNTAVGKDALKTNTTGSSNAALGENSLENNTTGSSNTGIGKDALRGNSTASDNTAVGHEALELTSTGAQNTIVGSGAGRSNTTADKNTGVGYYALISNTTVTRNTAVGANALDANTTANNNTAI